MTQFFELSFKAFYATFIYNVQKISSENFLYFLSRNWTNFKKLSQKFLTFVKFCIKILFQIVQFTYSRFL